MRYPHVTFKKSPEKDFETLLAFTEEAKYDGGRNLNWAVLNKYPQLKIYFYKGKQYKIKSEQALNNFINEIYRAKRTTMDLALTQHKKRWEKIAPQYFSLVDAVFNGREWPQGKYTAFGTIWGMYPRFLEDKTFQIPFWHRTPKYIPIVIAHELLHFMFYDYFYSKYPKYLNPKHNYFVWHISEIFNTVIQNSPTWVSCFKLKSLGYPEHEKTVSRISRSFYRQKTWNLDTLVDLIIKEVQQNKILSGNH